MNSISKASSSPYLGWVIWILGCLFYFYENFLQVSPSVMSNELMRDFQVTSQTLGVLSGVYFYSYAALQLPCGILMDFFGPKRILFIATAICAASTLAFGATQYFPTACIARLMIGFGSAFAAVGTMKLAANWFKADKFALLTGMMVTIGMLGGICGETPQALLVDSLGWRKTMTIMGGIGLVLAFIIYLVVKDKPNSVKNPSSSTQVGLKQGLLNIIKNKQLWIVACYGGLIYMCTPVFCGLWGVPFLMNKLAMTKAEAANAISLVLIGWAIASPLWGIYTNYVGRRKPALYWSAVGTLICLSFVIYLPISKLQTEIVLFAFGIFSAGFLPAFSLAKDMCNERYVATGLSFMNMMNMIGIALAQPVVGLILDKLWSGTMQNGVRVYSLLAYQQALSLLPMGAFIALLLVPMIKEVKATQPA
ncbi:MAG TPA: MFS transporter [Legionellales bacterium]|nr:MFS transporter [Legionellales bacterium]